MLTREIKKEETEYAAHTFTLRPITATFACITATPFWPIFSCPPLSSPLSESGRKKGRGNFYRASSFLRPQKAATKVSILRSKENIKASTFPLKGMCLYFSFCERASRNHTQNFYAPRFHLKYKGPLPDNFSSCPSGHFRVKFPPAADQKMRGRQKV